MEEVIIIKTVVEKVKVSELSDREKIIYNSGFNAGYQASRSTTAFAIVFKILIALGLLYVLITKTIL